MRFWTFFIETLFLSYSLSFLFINCFLSNFTFYGKGMYLYSLYKYSSCFYLSTKISVNFNCFEVQQSFPHLLKYMQREKYTYNFFSDDNICYIDILLVNEINNHRNNFCKWEERSSKFFWKKVHKIDLRYFHKKIISMVIFSPYWQHKFDENITTKLQFIKYKYGVIEIGNNWTVIFCKKNEKIIFYHYDSQ